MSMTGTDGRSMLLTCYADTHGYGWHHVDLFTHDRDGRELGWVHWQVDRDGPDGADDATGRAEPALRRTSPWEHGVSADGGEYWTARAAWGDSAGGDEQWTARAAWHESG